MDYHHFESRPVSGAIGTEIHGLDLSQSLTDCVVTELRRALLDHQVLFFRDQDLTPAEHLAFARRFGRLSLYPFVRGMDDYPEIVEVTKTENEVENFGGIWHSDTTYLEEPPLGSVLYARELPPVGGDTLFANMCLAYESLSPGMQALLEGLVAVNSADKPEAAKGRDQSKQRRPKNGADRVLWAEHPIVRTHPETGRKCLYVNCGHTLNIKGMTVEESRPLLEPLYAHQRKPEFCCRFTWRIGSIAFWDNRACQHYAVNDYQGHRRVMHRITLAGDRPF